MRKLLILLLVLWASTVCAQVQVSSPFDPGAARKDFSNVSRAVGLSALGLDLRLDTVNASFTGDIDVTGDVGAATVNGVAPLTAAEKTQALVGSSTVDFSAKALTVASFSYFGELSTGIKMKVLSGTTAGTEGATVTVAHGLTGDKILCFISKVASSSNMGFPHSYGAPFDYSVYHNATSFAVTNTSGASSNILSVPFKITVFYLE